MSHCKTVILNHIVALEMIQELILGGLERSVRHRGFLSPASPCCLLRHISYSASATECVIDWLKGVHLLISNYTGYKAGALTAPHPQDHIQYIVINCVFQPMCTSLVGKYLLLHSKGLVVFGNIQVMETSLPDVYVGIGVFRIMFLCVSKENKS